MRMFQLEVEGRVIEVVVDSPCVLPLDIYKFRYNEPVKADCRAHAPSLHRQVLDCRHETLVSSAILVNC